jgi:hypothetical protein
MVAARNYRSNFSKFDHFSCFKRKNRTLYVDRSASKPTRMVQSLNSPVNIKSSLLLFDSPKRLPPLMSASELILRTQVSES